MPAPITNIEDLRVMARRRVPKALFEYVDGGSYDELTLRANRADLDAIRLRQRVMVDTSTRDLSTTMLGEKVAMPVAIAPTGLTGLIHGDGEILAARAAEAAGLKFCLSTLSICTIEDVAPAVKRPIWYQLYVFKDRGFARAMIERASAVGCTTMFLTVDLPYRGQRHADIKNGLTVPPRLTLRNCWDIATKPN
jgi:L-lactate dehydrogenase (cytochrome)